MREEKKKNSTFRAFRNRNYALFFTGQSVSQIGTWMQKTALSWVVYTMTHSTFMLGLTMFASQFPSLLFSLIGGIVSDRHDRYKMLLGTQVAFMIQAVMLAALVLIGHYTVWQIMALSVVLGVINAFDVPARQPLVHQLVDDKEDLPNALALNAAMNNLARLVGPALSGIVLQRFGAGVCFTLNALSFVAVIGSLLLMKLPPYIPVQKKKAIVTELRDSVQYLRDTPAISTVLFLLAAVSLLVLPYDTLLPVFAKVTFKGDAATFGYINSFIGVGAVCGTLLLASLKPGTDLKKVLFINTIGLGISLAVFSHVSNFPVAMFFAALCGVGTMSQTIICITLLQVGADAGMRGRVMSFVAMAYFGMLPVGALLIGYLSQHIGPENALLCQAAAALFIPALFYNFFRSSKATKESNVTIEEAEDLAIKEV